MIVRIEKKCSESEVLTEIRPQDVHRHTWNSMSNLNMPASCQQKLFNLLCSIQYVSFEDCIVCSDLENHFAAML